MPSQDPTTPLRRGEYAARGDYHRDVRSDWEYYPTYVAKLERVRAYLDELPGRTRVLDVGCGEGVLVEEYASRLAIQGVDVNYVSDRVRAGSATALPFGDTSFDRVLCLDVLEHLALHDQAAAIAELFRVLVPDGEALVSVPNLAHLQSRVSFFLRGKLVRTANERKHPGDRPIAEYLALARNAGFIVLGRDGIFPTVPVLTRAIRRHPESMTPVHRWLTRLIPVPGWCFLNLLRLGKPARGPVPEREAR
jgi:SAM-dependent methyltransferase